MPSGRGGADHQDQNFHPLELALPAGERPSSGKMVTFSPAAHHAGFLSLKTAIQLCRAGSKATVQGAGLFSATGIVHPAFQLQQEYGNRVKTGVFAQITTEKHELYPRVVVFGFSMVAADPEFAFPNVVREKIAGVFADADVVRTGRVHLTVVTDDYAFREQLVDEYVKNVNRAWRDGR